MMQVAKKEDVNYITKLANTMWTDYLYVKENASEIRNKIRKQNENTK